MKILILLKFPLYGGGSGSYTRLLAESLVDDGHVVAIVTPDNRAIKGVKIYSAKLPFQAVFETHPELKRGQKYRTLSGSDFTRIYYAFLTKTVEAVEDFEPDIIHVQHASYLTWIANFVKSFYRIPFLVTVHGSDIYNTSLDTRFRSLTEQALRRSEFLICVSPYVKKWLVRIHGRFMLRKVRIIPGGINLKDIEPAIGQADLEKKYQLNHRPVILSVGRLSKTKGLEYLIQAAPMIKGLILIIGDGESKDDLIELAKKTASNIRFLGYLGMKDKAILRAFYKRANVLVVPSVWDEALGLVILEAMALETPVVASKKGGISLAVKNGQTGFLVRARSPKALSQAINTILDDTSLNHRLGLNAKNLIYERFSWQILINEIEKLYDRTLEVRQKLLAKQKVDLLDPKAVELEKRELTQKIDYLSTAYDNNGANNQL